MKLMPALPESIFDIGYLAFAIISGVLMLKNEKGRRLATLFGAMTLVLGCGDAFHLIPRVLNYFTNLNMTAALGIGKLVTSVTMTVFYVLLEYARRERYGDTRKGILLVTWVLAAIRIVLCCFPQNAWISENPPLLWGILRNIPFVVILGEDEIAKRTVQVKNMTTGVNTEFSIDDVQAIKDFVLQ